MSIEEGSTASGQKRGLQFQYMTMEEARREEARLEDKLARMESKLESIESVILYYKSKVSEYEQQKEIELRDQNLSYLNRELGEKAELLSYIYRTEDNLSELRESMGKKARMHHEGMADNIQNGVYIILYLTLTIVTYFLVIACLHFYITVLSTSIVIFLHI